MKTRQQTIQELADKIYDNHMITYTASKQLANEYVKFIEDALEDYKWKSVAA